MSNTSAIAKFLKKQSIYDNDLVEILEKQGIVDPENDFKTYSQKQWDELWRAAVVERAKELKDQQAKVRLEKKVKKLEAFWRTQSGIKSTSINASSKASKDDEKAPADQSSKASDNELLEKASDLAKFLKKQGMFNMDLLSVLSNHGVNKEADIATNISTNLEWSTIFREARNLQRSKTKDNDSRVRFEKNLKKFEKIWRQRSGIQETSQQKGKKRASGSSNKSPQSLELKKWMQKNQIWQDGLYSELLANSITSEEDLKTLKENDFDEIVRKVRVDRFKELKDNEARKRADKLLISFEKIWRKQSGIKKTSQKKK